MPVTWGGAAGRKASLEDVLLGLQKCMEAGQTKQEKESDEGCFRQEDQRIQTMRECSVPPPTETSAFGVQEMHPFLAPHTIHCS